MGMTIGEANDVQHVLQHLAGAKNMDAEEFLAAVERLGNRSSKALSAGYSGQNLRAGFVRRARRAGTRGLGLAWPWSAA